MKSPKLMTLIALLTISVLLLSSCAPKATQAEPTKAEVVEEATQPPVEEPTQPPAEKVKITLYFTPDEGSQSSCWNDTGFVPFNDQSDTVILESVPQMDAWNTTRTALAGGAGPDVVMTPGPSFVYELVQAGQLMALDDFAATYGWKDAFVPWALSLGSVEGKLYSLPSELETLVLYYNKTLFEKNGWTPPTTIDELWALSEKIQAAGVIPFGHMNAEWRPANEWHVGEFLNHVAGPQKVYDALTGKIPWTDPDFIKAIDLLNEAQQKKWFMGGLDLYYTTTFDDAHNALGKGEAAMNIEGTWAASDLNETYFTAENGGNEWDWVPVPSTSGKAIFDIGIGSTWSINAKTKYPEAVAEFLTYWFSSEVQTRLLVECGAAPAPVHLNADAMTGVDPRIARIFEEFAKASDAGDYGYTTWTFWPPKSDVYIYEEIEKVWSGEISSKEYLQGLQDQFTTEFTAGEIPPIPKR
jgi:raffinose/stachyose/melibiose transport system substrate-binding protein